MAKPARAASPRRLRVTPALLADVRTRYEESDEPLAGLAADLGCSIETVRNLAKREGWARYVPPPRDLSRAAKVRIQVEALTQQQAPPMPAPAESPEQDGSADVVAAGSPPAPVRGPAEGRTRGGERTEDDVAPIESTAAPPDIADTARQLHDELLALIAEIKAARQRMKRNGYGKRDLQEASRTIVSLSGALHKLDPLLNRVPLAESDDDYDDMPADIDAFREALARKIDAFMESRTDADDAEDDDAAGLPEA